MSNLKLPIIGILGDGQLAAMMATAYKRMGGQTFIYGGSKDSPAGPVADQFFIGDPEDESKLEDFLKAVDIATLENEFYPSEQLIRISRQAGTVIYPEPERYQLIEDKLSEKRYFQSLGVSVAAFDEIINADQLADEPGFLKLAKGGYDGIGTYQVENQAEARRVFDLIKDSGQVLFEQQIQYQKELSLLAVSGKNENVYYPLVETHQDDGTCRYVSFPAGVSEQIESQAREMVEKILAALNTRGVFAFELFLTQEGELILNESAPRPHNSGHISLDLYDVSQFESHMRAVAGLPLATPQAKYDAAIMVNLLATKDGPFDEDYVGQQLDRADQSVELYGKSLSRPKRKMGHVNLWGSDLWPRAKDIVETLDI